MATEDESEQDDKATETLKNEAVSHKGNVVNLGFGIEEVPSGQHEVEDDIDLSEMTSTEMSRYKFRLVNQEPANYRLVSQQAEDTAEVISLKHSSEDGLYHPEKAPSYSDLFQQEKNVVIEVDFNEQFGNKVEPGGESSTSNKISSKRKEVELGRGAANNKKASQDKNKKDILKGIKNTKLQEKVLPSNPPTIHSRIDDRDEEDNDNDNDLASSVDQDPEDPDNIDVSKLAAEHRGPPPPPRRRPLPGLTGLVVKQLPPPPRRGGHRARYPAGRRPPVFTEPIYNYSPPSLNTVRGVLVHPGDVRTLPPKLFSPRERHRSSLPSSSLLPSSPDGLGPTHPYRSRLDDFTREDSVGQLRSPSATFKREIGSQHPQEDGFGQPPLASYVVARKYNKSIPAYPIPHNLVPTEDVAVAEEAEKATLPTVATVSGSPPVVIPRPPGSPRPARPPNRGATKTGQGSDTRSRSGTGSSRLRYLNQEQSPLDSDPANSIARYSFSYFFNGSV